MKYCLRQCEMLTSSTRNIASRCEIYGNCRMCKLLCFAGSFGCARYARPTSWPGADTRNFNHRDCLSDRSLVSVDLRTDEISSTGGHRFFAPFFTENCPLDTFPGVPNPRMTLFKEKTVPSGTVFLIFVHLGRGKVHVGRHALFFSFFSDMMLMNQTEGAS